MYILYEAAATFVYMPYFALTPELTLDYDERTSLTSYRMFFSIVGSLIAFTVPLAMVGKFTRENAPRIVLMGLTFGLVSAAGMLTTFFGTRERPENQQPEPPKLRDSLRAALKNRPFIFGAASSAVAGYFGMQVALMANGRSATAAKEGLSKAFPIAFNAGGVMGMAVVGLAVLGMSVIYLLTEDPGIVLGFSFGASALALLATLGLSFGIVAEPAAADASRQETIGLGAGGVIGAVAAGRAAPARATQAPPARASTTRRSTRRCPS